MIRVLPFALAVTFVFSAGIRPAAAAFQCEKFEKNADGTWVAKEPVQILGPSGRLDFTPGETYREGQTKQGFDMAKLLAANCDKKP